MCIITHAKASNRKRGDGNYYENHHILPKSLFPLWEKRKLNQVLLTAREHFFCHQLLTKIYPSFEMEKALSIFCKFKQDKRALTSRQYEICRKAAHRANLLWWSDDSNRERMRKNLHEALKTRKIIFSEKTKRQRSERCSKSHWYNNGEQETFSVKCPDGFIPGRLKLTKEQKQHRLETLRKYRANRTEEEKRIEFERRSLANKKRPKKQKKNVNLIKYTLDEWNNIQKKAKLMAIETGKTYSECISLIKKEVCPCRKYV
jgi:hypothetical protein